MSNETKKTALPKLRFPEFQGSAEWAEKKFGDIAPLQRGFDLPTYELKTGTIPVVFSNGIQKFHSEGRAIAPGIVTGRSGTIGKIHFIKEGEYWPHNTSLWVTDFKNNDPEFIYFLYKSVGTERFASGSGVPTLNRNDVHAFKTYIPKSVQEQRKIAATLSSIDDIITAQSAKLEALQTHKRGLMQALFPAEGETVPKLRFPDFQDAKVWKKVKLSTQVQLISGLHLSPEEYGVKGEIPYFSGPSDYANELTLVSKWTLRSTNIGRAGDTLITVKGSGAGGLFQLVLDEVALGRQLMAVRAISAHEGYIFHFLATQKPRLISLATGNLIPGLSRTDILGLDMMIPAREEQKKIADCLTSLDNRITAQTLQIDAFKLHKKGLMQSLFPMAIKNN